MCKDASEWFRDLEFKIPCLGTKHSSRHKSAKDSNHLRLYFTLIWHAIFFKVLSHALFYFTLIINSRDREGNYFYSHLKIIKMNQSAFMTSQG